MMPAERPILFSGPMIVALLEGRKTMTRRVVKLPMGWSFPPARFENGGINRFGCDRRERIECPYGKPSDRLWVRETFCIWDGGEHARKGNQGVTFRADCLNDHGVEDGESERCRTDYCEKWKPSIFMPRWASRITLEITDVKVERLQEISESEAIAEGWPKAGGDFREAPGNGGPFDWYKELWNSINTKRGFGWDLNPWVWAITFPKIA